MIGKTNSRCCCRNQPRTHQLLYPSLRAPKFPLRLTRLLNAGKAIVCSTLFCAESWSQNIEYRTLPELVEAGSAALEQGNYPLAAHVFNSLYQNYNEEPIWQNSELPSIILPLAGFASFKSNLHPEAIEVLQAYLEESPNRTDDTLFAKYTLASSLLLNGQANDAREAFSEIQTAAGTSPFRDLALLQEAQLSAPEVAIPLLKRLLKDPASNRLATYARLRLISLGLETGNLDISRIHLLNTKWNTSQIPESATLSLLAIQVAEKLETDDPGSALRAYQLIQPRSELIAAQTERIQSLKNAYQQIAPTLNSHHNHWSEQLKQQLSQQERQLEELQKTPDYYDSIILRKARCFTLINRPVEAWILQESLALSHSPLAREAHLDWIATARELHDWKSAARIAHAFIDKYPSDPDIAQPMLWIALSLIELKDYRGAISALQRIQENTQKSLYLASSNYYIGYCHYMSGNTSSAVPAFQSCIEQNPLTPLSGQAQLWIGICHFTSNQLERAIEAFQEIQDAPHYTVFHAEAAYRKASCYFALGDLGLALEQLKSWLKDYPIHPRLAEALALLGDIQSEKGDIEAAIAAYQSVQTADLDLAFHTVEQLCLIRITQNDPRKALEHLRGFEDEHQVPPKHIGRFTKLKLLCLDPQQTEAEITQVLADYGSLPESIGLVELIQELPNTDIPEKAHPSLLSRYLVSEILSLRKKGSLTQAKLRRLQLVTDFKLEQLPPLALIEAGEALLEIESHEARNYFEHLLSQHPESSFTGQGNLGLAKHHYTQGNLTLALATLYKLELPPPEALKLKLTLELELERYPKARKTAQSLLADRRALPSQKAFALNTLGKLEYQSGNPLDAYAHHQRVFTLYRGELEQVALAYSACIEILSSENRYKDAEKLMSEFLSQTDLSQFPCYQETQLNQQPHAQATL